MALLKNGRLIQDRWTTVDNLTDALKPGGVLVPLELWLAERDTLRGKSAVGVILPNDADLDLLADDYDRIAAIVLTFPSMVDGRAFSQARLIRERFGFDGEIRARGPVIADQYLYLLRCGVDAVEVPDDTNVESWLRNARRFSAVYQPAADDRIPAYRRRHLVAASAIAS
ncbi:MAG: oxidoreductase [Minwuia thermotolerans]|nr:MAG: oxidoreductase [Minwuia thermotolerans]